MTEEIIASKKWVCKFCGVSTSESTDMWLHMMNKHGASSVSTNGDYMWTETIAPSSTGGKGE